MAGRLSGSGLAHVGVVLAMVFATTAALGSPLPPKVVADSYNPAHQNGIPTPQDATDGTPDVYDAVNLLTGSHYTRNWQIDGMFVASDAVWSNLDERVVMIGLTAAYTNTVGFYTDPGVGSTKTNLLGPVTGFGFRGSGTADDPFSGAMADLSSGEALGFYLYANQQQYYYSESELNPGGWDHMMTYALGEVSTFVDFDDGDGAVEVRFEDAYLIGWEDLPWKRHRQSLGDDDFDDMMYLVAVLPEEMPEPGVLALVASGVVFFCVTMKRRMLG